MDYKTLEKNEGFDREILTWIKTNIGEIMVCDEHLKNINDENARLGKFHVYSLNKTAGEEEGNG